MLLVSGGTAVFRPQIAARPDIFGTLVTPVDGNSLPEFGRWAADNAAFIGPKDCPLCKKGRIYLCSRHAYGRSDQFVKMLRRHQWARGRCLFVTCPDVVGDHAATLVTFAAWAPQLAEFGWPLAFVLQDGCDADGVPWDRIAAVFIGGTDKFKLGAWAAHIATVAAARGKWVHMGRVNTARRLHYAAAIGSDSVDGSGWSKYSESMLARHARLLRDLAEQRRLVLDALEGA